MTRSSLRASAKDFFRATLDRVSRRRGHRTVRPGLRILNYHGVPAAGAPVTSRPYTHVSEERFRRHLALLRQAGFEVTTVSRLVSRLAARASGPDRLIALSFDDGLAEHASVVLPLLRETRATATFYVLSGLFGQRTSAGYGGRFLEREEVLALRDARMEIGSHGRSHRVLSRLTEADLESEVNGSREDLANLLGSPPVSFAYPYGSRRTIGAGAVAYLRAAGYEHAVCTTIGANFAETSRFHLRRIPMYQTDDDDVVLAKAAGAYDWVGRLQEAWLLVFPHHSIRSSQR